MPVRTLCCPFHDGNGPMQSTCHQVAGWSPLRMVPHGRAQTWFLLLADRVLSSGWSQVGIGSPCCCPCVYISYLLPWPLCAWAHQCVTGVSGERNWWYPQNVSSSYLTENPLLLRLPFGKHSQGKQISSHFSLIQRVLSSYISLKSSCHQFLYHDFFRLWSFSPTIGHSPWIRNIQYRIYSCISGHVSF